MKFIILPITAAATFLASSCAQVQAIEDDAALALIKNNLQTLTATAKDNLQTLTTTTKDNIKIDIDISPECKAEIESLAENDNLMTAGESLGRTCPYSQNGNNLKQDFGSCDMGQFQLACTAAGGKSQSQSNDTRYE